MIELLQKGTKVNPSQISLKWEQKMPARGAFKAWKRSFLGYSLLPQVFSQKTLLSGYLVSKRRLQPKSHHCSSGSQEVSG